MASLRRCVKSLTILTIYFITFLHLSGSGFLGSTIASAQESRDGLIIFDPDIGITRRSRIPARMGVGTRKVASTEELQAECGTWRWDGPIEEKDLRIKTTLITEASGSDCHGAFRFSNDTGVWGFGGYSFELQAHSENAEFMWQPPATIGSQGTLITPLLDIELHNTPLNRTSDAQVFVLGEMTLSTVALDTGIFLIKTALALSPPGTECFVPEEQILFTGIRITNILTVVAELALKGDFVGAREEFFQIADHFYERSGEVMLELGIDCASDLLKSIAKKPALIAKIGITYLTWVPVVIMDYFKYQGQNAAVDIVYTPPQSAITPLIGQIAYIESAFEAFSLKLMNADGSGIETLYTSWLGDFTWSSDGQNIVYAERLMQSNQWQLRMLNMNSGENQIIVFPERVPYLAKETYFRYSNPRFSSDGGALFYLATNDYPLGRSINKLSLSTGQTEGISPPDLTSSFDVSQITGEFIETWCAMDYDYRCSLFLHDNLGVPIRNIFSREKGELCCVSWSPGGNEIAFIGPKDLVGGLSQGGNIWIVSKDGSNLRQLTSDHAYLDSYPCWSTDGYWIAFSSRPISGGTSDIWVVSKDGKHSLNLTNTPNTSEVQPVWRP